MELSPLKSLQRVVSEGASRRSILGAAVAAVLSSIGLSEVDAKKKRKKNKKKRNKKRRGGGNNGGGNGGGGGNECQFEICDGQCVDTATDPNNCGACGGQCGAGDVCRQGFCVSEIDEITGAFGLAVTGDDSFAVTSPDIRNIRLIVNNAREGAIDVPGPATGGSAQPTGIAFDASNGTFVVIDTANSRVIRLEDDGGIVSEFGSFGSGQLQFEFPEGVAIDTAGAGQIFVLDTGNNLVKRYTSSGFFLGQFGGAGSGEGKFDNPRGIAIDANRNVVVADTGNNRIQILDQDGDVVRVIGSAGNSNGQFNAPAGVGIRDNGGIVVADTGNNRIQFFDASGAFDGAFGRAGAGLGEFNAPVGVVERERGSFVVADQGNDRVQIVSFSARP